MIGGGATAVRALIMGLIAIVARYFGRPSAALRALALAAAVMVLWNPTSLLYDPSFILSILATFGLITLSSAVEAKLPRFLSRMPHIRSIAASTIAVQLYVLPALLYMTGVFSLFALPANILALPSVPFAMGFGFAAGLLGFVHPTAALPAAIITDALLRFMILVATSIQMLPFSASVVTTFPLWIAIVVYLPLTFFALWCYHSAGSENEPNGGLGHDEDRKGSS
jgi:competence protein ComEC